MKRNKKIYWIILLRHEIFKFDQLFDRQTCVEAAFVLHDVLITYLQDGCLAASNWWSSECQVLDFWWQALCTLKLYILHSWREATDDAVSNKGDLTTSTQSSLRTFVSALEFVIIHCHFVVMSPLDLTNSTQR